MTVGSSPSRLVGRARECGVLTELVTRIESGRSGVLVLEGEAGVGKSALLAYLTEQARTCRTVRAAGVQSEMVVAYAGLHMVCAPFLARVDVLPDPQRDALEVAFGHRDGPPPSRFMICLAALTLLTNAAETQPLICVVDDAQWLDRESAQALSFVARRLLAERMAMVFAVRQLPVDHDLAGLTVLHVAGLADQEARQLLNSVLAWPVDDHVRHRLLRETHGNPLAILEVPRTSSPTELAFGVPDTAKTSIASRIEEGFQRRLRALPEVTRQLLLLAALEPSGNTRLVKRAGNLLGIDIESAAAPAVEVGLLDEAALTTGAVRLRHPLVRSAVYQLASEAAIRSVHTVLADVTDTKTDPDRQVWHRAHAVTGLDGEVANELEACAHRAMSRGGLGAAAAFFERSMALTADPVLRARRALTAAEAKHQAGEPEQALTLLAIAESGPLEPLELALVHLARAHISIFSHHSGEAPRQLLGAARALEPLDLRLARHTYLDALSAAIFAGRLASDVGLRELASAALAAPRLPGTRDPEDLLLEGFALVIDQGYIVGAPILQRAVAAFRSTEVSWGEALRWLWLATHAAHDLWDDESWEVLNNRHIELARRVGALHILPISLSARMGLHLFAGELRTVDALVHETAAVIEATGSTLPPYGAIALAAWRGRETEATRMIEATLAEVVARGDGMGLTLIRHAQAVLFNGLGRYAEAFAASTEAAAHPSEFAFASWALPELVEAAVNTGYEAAGEQAAGELAELAEASGTDWALGVLARCRALLSDDPIVAEAHYRDALERLSRTRMVMVLARTRLVYGEWLRRRNRRAEARHELRTAYEVLAAMGAEAFADRARRELAAAGGTVPQTHAATPVEDLTAQELVIARYAAAGLTNPEIGANLFISARTVEWHLRKVFHKLGISSRKQLQVTQLAT